MNTHYGDPCIHCGIGHDDVQAGACNGDHKKAVPLFYSVYRQAWQMANGCDSILIKMSNGDVVQKARHPAEHWPYNNWFRNAECLAPHEFQKRFQP